MSKKARIIISLLSLSIFIVGTLVGIWLVYKQDERCSRYGSPYHYNSKMGVCIDYKTADIQPI